MNRFDALHICKAFARRDRVADLGQIDKHKVAQLVLCVVGYTDARGCLIELLNPFVGPGAEQFIWNFHMYILLKNAFLWNVYLDFVRL